MAIGTAMAQNDSSGNLQGIASKDGVVQEHRDNRAERRDQNRNNRAQLQAQRTGTRASAGRVSRARQ